MKRVAIGLLLALGMAQAGHFEVELPSDVVKLPHDDNGVQVRHEEGRKGEREDQLTQLRSALKDPNGPKISRKKVGFVEADPVVDLPVPEQSVVAGELLGGDKLPEESEAAIEVVADEFHGRPEGERTEPISDPQSRITREIEILETALQEAQSTQSDAKRIQDLTERLTALKNTMELTQFLKASDKLKDIAISVPQFEKLFIELGLPDLSDDAIDAMDRHKLSELKSYEDLSRYKKGSRPYEAKRSDDDKTLPLVQEKVEPAITTSLSVMRDADLSVEQKDAFIEFIYSRIRVADEKLKVFMKDDEEEDKEIRKVADAQEAKASEARFKAWKERITKAAKDLVESPDRGEAKLEAENYLKTALRPLQAMMGVDVVGPRNLVEVLREDSRVKEFSIEDVKEALNFALTIFPNVAEFVAEKLQKVTFAKDNDKIQNLCTVFRDEIKIQLDYADRFVGLRKQADQALAAGDVIALQKLQDKLRDLYEKTFKASFKDQGLENLRVGLQKQINQLLAQFKEKLSSFQGLMAPRLKGVALVQHKVERFFTRVKMALKTRSLGYVSELKANKQNGFGLQTVDFSAKTVSSEYVVAAKKKLASGDKDEINQVHDELDALQAIRDSKGVVSGKKASQYLDYTDPETHNLYTWMTRLNGSAPYKELAKELCEKTVLPKQKAQADAIIDKIFKKERLSLEEQKFVEELYAKWVKDVEKSMRKLNPRIDLTALQILAKFNGADATFLNLLKTKETAMFAIEAFRSQKGVSMPLKEAQLVLKDAELKKATESKKTFL